VFHQVLPDSHGEPKPGSGSPGQLRTAAGSGDGGPAVSASMIVILFFFRGRGIGQAAFDDTWVGTGRLAVSGVRCPADLLAAGQRAP